MSTESPLIELINISAGYGQVEAVSDVSLKLMPGEMVAILGRNGVGKTTTMLATIGEVAITKGELRYSFVTKSRRGLASLAQAGLAYVGDDRSLFPGLTAEKNCSVAKVDINDVFTYFPELKGKAGVRAGDLSGGEQQMLSIGRALARLPRVLLVDEVSLGLAPQIIVRLYRELQSAARSGVGVILVEQYAKIALDFADRIYVIDGGRTVFEGTSSELRTDYSDLSKLYL